MRGARHVGKSWPIRTWGAQRFAAVIEVNLERRPEAAVCFSQNDPLQTLRHLEVLLGRTIPTDGTVLIVLDEIQAVPAVPARLRWFAEELPQVPVIAAGSLLDLAIAAARPHLGRHGRMDERGSILTRLAARIAGIRNTGPLLVGIDGTSGCGRTVFAGAGHRPARDRAADHRRIGR